MMGFDWRLLKTGQQVEVALASVFLLRVDLGHSRLKANVLTNCRQISVLRFSSNCHFFPCRLHDSSNDSVNCRAQRMPGVSRYQMSTLQHPRTTYSEIIVQLYNHAELDRTINRQRAPPGRHHGGRGWVGAAAGS